MRKYTVIPKPGHRNVLTRSEFLKLPQRLWIYLEDGRQIISPPVDQPTYECWPRAWVHPRNDAGDSVKFDQLMVTFNACYKKCCEAHPGPK